MSPKRRKASFIPYYKKEGQYFFFLQMRDEHAETNPNRYGRFGGGIEENETPEEAVRREVKEELDIVIEHPTWFCHFEFFDGIEDCFILEVDESFPNTVTVLEGKYGRFLSETEVKTDPLVTEASRLVLFSLAEWLRKGAGSEPSSRV